MYQDLTVDFNSRVKTIPMSYYHIINIDKELVSISDWSEEISVIRSAKESDVIHIIVSSTGGDVDVALAIISAMDNSPAYFITEAVGTVASAATLIFLHGHEYRINPDVSFMMHNASVWLGDKWNNIMDYVEFNNKYLRNLFEVHYSNFLTQQEIDSMLDGKNIWFDSSKLKARCSERLSSINNVEWSEEVDLNETQY